MAKSKSKSPTTARRKPARPARTRRSKKIAARKRPAAPRKPAARKPAPRKLVARKPRAASTRTRAASKPKAAARASRQPAPGLQRARRVLTEQHGVPSSLDVDRHASAARTGRAELAQHLRDHTETGPELTGGDIDADWVKAYDSGDEAPGGDNPTPDQDVVEDIGRALGVNYDDAEELRGSDKVADRDRRRWELDPASSEDYRDRKKK